MTDIRAIVLGRLRGRGLIHAYIITGSSPEGRLAAAEFIAKKAVCSGDGELPCGKCSHCIKADKHLHPDITFVEREKDEKELSVGVIRTVRSMVPVLPNEAEKSVYIIKDADTMNEQAQNAMLKVLEEPPAHVVFLLLADNPELLVGTVRSRCETIIIPPEEAEEPNELACGIMELVLRNDDAGLVEKASDMEKLSRNELYETVTSLRRLTVRTIGEGRLPYDRACRLIDALNECEKYINANVNAGHIAGLLLTFITE